MKTPYRFITLKNRIPSTSCGVLAFVSLFCLAPQAMAATTAVNLDSASGFAVLAGSGITFAGTVDSININGDIGSYPTPSITGFENVVLNGTNQAGNSVTQFAKTSLDAAYLDAASRAPDTTYDPIFDLGGLTLSPGVHSNPSSFVISGILTLDGLGDPSSLSDLALAFIRTSGYTPIWQPSSSTSITIPHCYFRPICGTGFPRATWFTSSWMRSMPST